MAAVLGADDGKIDAATVLVLQQCTVLVLLALAQLAAGVSVFCTFVCALQLYLTLNPKP